MQLGRPPGPRPTPPDVATAVRDAAADLGQRPAVTVLRPERREEQGVASLAQWAAKGAHLLEADLLLEPGDRLALRAPIGWPAAAVTLAAWWAGLTVTLDGGAEVAVAHERLEPPAGTDEVLWVGDAVDGAPAGDVPGEPWAEAVQAFPDQPPTPRGGADSPALEASGELATQAELLDRVAGEEGVLGVDASTIDPVTGLLAVTLRPLVAGRHTVVLVGVSRDAARGEQVTVWG